MIARIFVVFLFCRMICCFGIDMKCLLIMVKIRRQFSRLRRQLHRPPPICQFIKVAKSLFTLIPLSSAFFCFCAFSVGVFVCLFFSDYYRRSYLLVSFPISINFFPTLQFHFRFLSRFCLSRLSIHFWWFFLFVLHSVDLLPVWDGADVGSSVWMSSFNERAWLVLVFYHFPSD